MIGRGLLLCFVILQPAFAREWTSVDGVKVRAELIAVLPDSVVLKREDGKQAKVVFEKLSQRDLVYLLRTQRHWSQPSSAAKQNIRQNVENLWNVVGRLTLEDYWRMTGEDRNRVSTACSKQLPIDARHLRSTLDEFAQRRNVEKRRQILLGVAALSITSESAIKHLEQSLGRKLTPDEKRTHSERLTDAVQRFVLQMQ